MTPDPDMFPVPEPVEIVHGSFNRDDFLLKTACGMRVASRYAIENVTCEACRKALVAAGLPA